MSGLFCRVSNMFNSCAVFHYHLFFSFSKVDPYGFKRSDDFDSKTYEEFIEKYLPVLARRASKWQALLGDSSNLVKNRKCKYLWNVISLTHIVLRKCDIDLDQQGAN